MLAREKGLSAALSAAFIFIFTAVLFLGSSGCFYTGNTADEPTTRKEHEAVLQAQLQSKVEYTRENTDNLAKMIHDLINEERTTKGLDALRWDEALSHIAAAHSRDMAERGYFDHVSPEGKDFSDRYREHGYTRNTQIGRQVYVGGENLFQNNVIESYAYNQNTQEIMEYEFKGLEELARSTVEGWMESPGHRENILTPFSREGIGIYVTDEGEVYITENFS
ncbi:MAG: CAP domain-containing protein [Actinomycetota bacterium]